MEELQRRANEKYRMAKVYAKCTVCVYDVCADTCVCVCVCVCLMYVCMVCTGK